MLLGTSNKYTIIISRKIFLLQNYLLQRFKPGMLQKKCLYYSLTQLRQLSFPTYSFKPRPTNLQLTLVEGSVASEDTRLLDFYVDSVLREEPTVQAAGLTHSPELREYVRTSLMKQHTLQLTDLQGGSVVGGASGGPISDSILNDIRLYADKEMQDERCQQLVSLWVASMSEAAVFKSLHLTSVWHISYLGVEPHMRRLGLARFLLAQQSRLATKLGFVAITLRCSNDSASRMLQMAGYKSIQGKTLSSYMDTWLPRPHPEIHIFYKQLLVKKDYDTWFL